MEENTPTEIESVKIDRLTAKKYHVQSYNKLVVPLSMRSMYWQYFGFPATQTGGIISKSRIVCVLCKKQIAYNKNTSNLRMHLQNKHPATLEALQSQDQTDKMDTSEAGLTETFILKSECGGEEDSQVVFETINTPVHLTPRKKPKMPLSSQIVKPVTGSASAAVVKYIIQDLMPLSVVEQKGLQRLMTHIENPCDMPSKSLLASETIPNIYNQLKQKILQEVGSASYMALSIEEWRSDSGVIFNSIYAHYPTPSDNGTLKCCVLQTFTVFEEMDSALWLKLLVSIFAEWEIIRDNVTAVVCPMHREAMLHSLRQLEFEVVPCLSHTISESVKQVLQHDIIFDIVARVRKQVLFSITNPLIMETWTNRSDFLPLDTEAVWLSTHAMLKDYAENSEVIQRVLAEHVGEVFCGLKISEAEMEVIQDVVEVLQPLKMALMSVNEKKPFISLLKPLLHTVMQNKLAEDSNDSQTLTNLKKAIVELLHFRYFNGEDILPILDLSTVIDPRFKFLPHSSNEERTKIGDGLYNEIKDIVVQTIDEDDGDGEEEKDISNIELLLGQYNSRVRVKIDEENTAKLECQTYLAHPYNKLDSDPLQWWSKQQEKYPRLSHTALKYLCLPAVSAFPRPQSQQISFHKKRSALEPEWVDKLLFLNVNT